jgi:hypothetical protein
MPVREMLRYHAAHRDSDHMRIRDAEMIEQRARIVGDIGQLVRQPPAQMQQPRA